MRRALLPINTSTYFSDLFRLAKALRDAKTFEPLLLFVANYPTRAAHVRACDEEGIRWHIEPAVADAPAGPAPALDGAVPAPRARARFAAALGRRFPGLEEFRAAIRYQQSRMRYATSVFAAEAIDLVILAGDLVHYDAPAFVRAAHARGIPAVVAPSWMAGPLEAAEALKNVPANAAEGILARLFARARPRWAYVHQGRTLLRLPAARAIAMDLLRLGPPRPWVLHSGHADAVAVESEFMRDYCLREGLSAETLVVTGSAAHDVMARLSSRAQDARRELCRSLSLEDNRPILLSAVPPDQFAGGARSGVELGNYCELVEFWVRSLADVPGWNVVLSLHPSQTIEDWKHLEGPALRISTQKTETLMPLADLFVASVSSTIQWAIACGKPALNYDVYLYRYPDYATSRGVLLAETKDEFLRLLRALTTDTKELRSAADEQRRSAPYFGVLDGRAIERLTALFESLDRHHRA